MPIKECSVSDRLKAKFVSMKGTAQIEHSEALNQSRFVLSLLNLIEILALLSSFQHKFSCTYLYICVDCEATTALDCTQGGVVRVGDGNFLAADYYLLRLIEWCYPRTHPIDCMVQTQLDNTPSLLLEIPREVRTSDVFQIEENY